MWRCFIVCYNCIKLLGRGEVWITLPELHRRICVPKAEPVFSSSYVLVFLSYDLVLRFAYIGGVVDHQ